MKHIHLIRESRGRISFLTLILIVSLAALIPVALIGWTEVYQGFVEHSPPVITILEQPRGIGKAPVRLIIKVEDTGAGIDEVVVRATQKDKTREIERRSSGGAKSQTLTLHFPGQESGFEEGSVKFEIRAFDRTLWNNRGEKTLELPVDYRAPIVEVLSAQHNARVGGSQLLLYRAVDETLALSGVKVGKEVFLGYPARLLDADLQDKDLYGVIYAIPFETAEGQPPQIRAFAEDAVGNATLKGFYSRETERKIRPRKINISPACMRSQVHPLAERVWERLQEYLHSGGEEFTFSTAPGSPERHMEEFKLLNENLRSLDDTRFKQSMLESRFQRYWQQEFLAQSGTIRFGSGERLVYFADDQVLSDQVHYGYFYRERIAEQEVVAANGGVVALISSNTIYGSVVILDHGLGLFSLYGNLGKILVGKGDRVQIGDTLGTTGSTGLTCERGVLFEVRVQGVPVEPAEWLSKAWYNDHIDRKIQALKQLLGITHVQPF